MIVVVVDSMERYYFAVRLVKAVRKEFDFLFAASEPLAHLMALAAGFRSVYLRRGRMRPPCSMRRPGFGPMHRSRC